MAAVRRADTKIEVELRRKLHALGLRFRKDYRLDLAGGRVRPDIVFTRRKVAVFVDGCFWHVCPIHASWPKDNAEFWQAKLNRNVERNRQADEALKQAGWTIVRVWEHETLDEGVARMVDVLSRLMDNKSCNE